MKGLNPSDEVTKSFTAKTAKGAKEEKSFTAKDAKAAKEKKSFTAKEIIIGQKQNLKVAKNRAKGGIQEALLVI